MFHSIVFVFSFSVCMLLGMVVHLICPEVTIKNSCPKRIHDSFKLKGAILLQKVR